MPDIPIDEKSKTVIAIDEAWEAQQRGRHSYRLSPSTLGAKCDRQLWYSFRWASPIEWFSGQKLRIFETGKIYETRMLDDLERSGVTVVRHVEGEFDKDGKPKQIGVSFAKGHGYGFLDAEAVGVKEAKTKWHVVEAKSHNLKSYTYLIGQGVERAKPEHWTQMQIYMHKRDRSRALYIAACKDDDRIHTERIDYDIEFNIRLELRAERIAFSDWAPPRISDDPSRWPCAFCKHVDLCHNEGGPEFNCRTCLHIAARDEGAWHCVRHDRQLSREDQEKGCSSHLFLPSLIPGEQIDCSPKNETVTYRMRDGSIWIDGSESDGEEN